MEIFDRKVKKANRRKRCVSDFFTECKRGGTLDDFLLLIVRQPGPFLNPRPRSAAESPSAIYIAGLSLYAKFN